MNSADTLHLTHDGWCLQVSRLGGCVLSCTYQGQDILRSAKDDYFATVDPVLTSCFPLVPFSNRIANGQFTFGHQNIKLNKTRLEHVHPIHGYGWISEWTLEHHAQDKLELVLDYTGTDWPWAFRCKQSFIIKDKAVTFSLALQNKGTSPMPAGLGFHPYFPGADAALLKFRAGGYWKGDSENLPTTWQATQNDEAFRVVDQNFDNCFTGWDKFAEISWSDRCHKVEVEGSDLLDFAVLFTPQDEDYFCFEPVSHMNNALNLKPQSGQTGLQTLLKEKTMDISMTLRVVPQ